MRNFLVRTAAVGTLAIGCLAPTLPAQADNFAGCFSSYNNQPCFANNSAHYFSYGLDADWRTAQESTRVHSFETTDLSTYLSAHADSNGLAISDVHVGQTTSLSYAGIYVCQEYYGNGRCHHAHIAYLTASRTPEERWHIACHETGHSVGLRHPEDLNGTGGDAGLTEAQEQTRYGCMFNGNAFAPTGLGQHNADHINGKY